MSSERVIEQQSSRPAAAVALAFAFGIACALVCREYAFIAFVIAAGSLIAASFTAWRRRRTGIAWILALASIFMAGLLTALAHRDAFPDDDLRALISRHELPIEEPVLFEGCVDQDGEIRGGESVATIEVSAFRAKGGRTRCRGRAILRTTLPDPIAPPGFQPLQGDAVKGWAVWRIPRNYQNPGSPDSRARLARRGVFLIGRVKSPRLLETVPGGCASPVVRLASAIRTRVRERLASVERNEGEQPAAVLSSLLIGDYSGLNAATRESFQNSGTFHVLVVSGLHLAWTAAAFIMLLKLMRTPERARFALAAVLIAIYTCVVGFQASITRCLWTFLLYLAGKAIVRRADSLNVLLVSALILLAARPDWLFEAGFQLSFLSVAAIAITAAPAIGFLLKPLLDPLRHCGAPERLFLQPGRVHRLGRRLRTMSELAMEALNDRCPAVSLQSLLFCCRCCSALAAALGAMMFVSLSVQLWIDPLLACHFNRLSWIGPVANLIIVPFSSVVLAAGAMAVWATPFSGVAGSLSAWLLSWTSAIAAIPGGWQRCPTPHPLWVGLGIGLLFIWRFFGWRRFWMPCMYVLCLLACLWRGSLFAPLAPEFFRPQTGLRGGSDAILSFTFLDVGEGDAIVVSFPNGERWLLDAGGGSRLASEAGDAGFDLGEGVVSRYLWHGWTTRLDRLILSHSDSDHAGGAISIMENFSIDEFNSPRIGGDLIIDGMAQFARSKGIETKLLFSGIEQCIGGTRVRVLNPSERPFRRTSNESSVVLAFSYGRFSALLAGDLEKRGEHDLVSQSEAMNGLLLKVAHHGSRFGTSDRFLDRVSPRWAVISVGRNPFGHPSNDAINRLVRKGARPLLTSDQGAVTFETDGERYCISSHVAGVLERGWLPEPKKKEPGFRSQKRGKRRHELHELRIR